MYKLIRDKAPFLILAYTLVFTVASYFDFYLTWYKYLPDLLGYSLMTNLFMFSVYMNKRYCTATKVCVLGLIALNLFNLVYKTFDINGIVYDIYLILIIAVLSILINYKK